MSPLIDFIKTLEAYRSLGQKAIDQLDARQLHITPDSESNSIAVIIKHLHGNMLSRFTDFLTTDGEKPDRDRDSEFEDSNLSKNEILELYNAGWKRVLETLESLSDKDLDKIVKIRNEDHTVFQAIVRQIAHYSYHVGQIVYVAKMIRSENWTNLSIKKGQSRLFNEQKFGPLK